MTMKIAVAQPIRAWLAAQMPISSSASAAMAESMSWVFKLPNIASTS